MEGGRKGGEEREKPNDISYCLFMIPIMFSINNITNIEFL